VDRNPGDADARQHLMDAYQQKHFFTRSRWIVFNSGRADRRSRPHRAAFYGVVPIQQLGARIDHNSARRRVRTFSRQIARGPWSPWFWQPVCRFGGLRRDQEGIPLHRRSPCQYFRGHAIRGDFGKARKRQSGRGDGHAQIDNVEVDQQQMATALKSPLTCCGALTSKPARLITNC
jgi:hypothetical protein